MVNLIKLWKWGSIHNSFKLFYFLEIIWQRKGFDLKLEVKVRGWL